MAIRQLNVGKNFKNPIKNNQNTKAFKTEKMFKNLEELNVRADYLEQKKFEVKKNEKLLTIQYR